MTREDVDTRPITQRDLLNLAFNRADVLDPVRVIATFADESNWTQVYADNRCYWAMTGPACPPYELAQNAMKRLGLHKQPKEDHMGDAAELAMEAEMKYPGMDPIDAYVQHCEDLVEEALGDEEIKPTQRAVGAPIWCNFSTVPDPEVLVVMAQELDANGFYRIQPYIEDSRTGQKIIIEAALLFDEKHVSTDQDYWTERDFLEEVEIFAAEVVQKVKEAGPDFYNHRHHTMYGDAWLRDIMV